jgi:hypothetical protein
VADRGVYHLLGTQVGIHRLLGRVCSTSGRLRPGKHRGPKKEQPPSGQAARCGAGNARTGWGVWGGAVRYTGLSLPVRNKRGGPTIRLVFLPTGPNRAPGGGEGGVIA